MNKKNDYIASQKIIIIKYTTTLYSESIFFLLLFGPGGVLDRSGKNVWNFFFQLIMIFRI